MNALIRTLTERPLRLVAATLVLALAGGFALMVKAAPPSHGGAGGPMSMMMAPGHIDHMLDLVSASTEQRTQIKSIMDAARTDLAAQREAGHALQQQAMQLFTQPTVDANAAESLRQQMLAQHDQASKRMMQAMLEVSRVLTPDQRQLLSQKVTERQAMMERHRAAHESAGGTTN